MSLGAMCCGYRSCASGKGMIEGGEQSEKYKTAALAGCRKNLISTK